MNKVLSSLALVAILGASLAGQTVPTGFADELVHSGLVNPVGLGFTNDGRLFVTEKDSGRIYVCDLAGNKTLCGTVPNVATGSERGLLGVCVDPNWPASPYIYISYSHTTPSMRIARYTITGDVGIPTSLNLALGVRYDIITSVPDSAFNHNGGTVRFGPDGMLYASFGDDANSCTAQNATDGRGIIFRMDVSGLPAGAGGPASIASITPASGNVFTGGAFGPITYVYGLRNPFRFHADDVTGNLYVADVGQNAVEEYDEVTAAGQNFGWPRWEGNNNGPTTACPPAVTPIFPIAAVPQTQGWFSIMSFGGRYRNQVGGTNNFGPAFEGDVFYHDYYSGQVRRLQWNGSAWVAATPTNWATGFQNVSDALVGPDGAIYYVRNVGAGQIRRVRGTANAPQLLALSPTTQPGNAGQPAFDDLRVRLTNPAGSPIVGSTINFSISTGGGSLSATSAVTDSNGEASVSYTFDPTLATNGTVIAQLAGDPGVQLTFTMQWRGITANYISSVNLLVTTFRSSQNSMPYILAVDLPAPMPFISTPWGDVWTGLLNPSGALLVLDGTGLFAPADPNFVTGATNGVDVNTYTVPASMSPTTFRLQGYGVDSSLLPTNQAIIITNFIDLTL